MTPTIYFSKKVQALITKYTKPKKQKRKFSGKRYLTTITNI